MIPCVICNRMYAVDKVGTELFISTGVCIRCYRIGASMPASHWCFAKKEIYDPESKECAALCPDRYICGLVIAGRLNLTRRL